MLSESCPRRLPSWVAMRRRATILLAVGASNDHIPLHISYRDLLILTQNTVIIFLVFGGGWRLTSRKFLHINEAIFGPFIITEVNTMHLVIVSFLCMVRIRSYSLSLLDSDHVDVCLPFFLSHLLTHILGHHVLGAVCRVRGWSWDRALRLLCILENRIHICVPQL